MTQDWQLWLQRCVRTACRTEVSATKPGNVCPGHEFEDASWQDFLKSADAVAPVIAATAELGVGAAILRSVQVTREVVGHNTNLGILLLLAPLAAVPQQHAVAVGIEHILARLDVDDAKFTYQAIQLASPGGLGSAAAQDVSSAPSVDLRSCMQLAADRDLIAAQYANGFREVLQTVLPLLIRASDDQHWAGPADLRLAWVAVQLLASFGDSLIVRKCGADLNRQVQQQAGHLLDAGWPVEPQTHRLYQNFDAFLRADGNRRNPGTTADLIAAAVFVALRDRLLPESASIIASD